MSDDDNKAVLDKLARYGYARDRSRDRELRTVTLTDDEAVLVVKSFRAIQSAFDEQHKGLLEALQGWADTEAALTALKTEHAEGSGERLIREDEQGVFVRTGGYTFRPRNHNGFKYVSIRYKAGDRVKAHHIPSTTTAQVGEERWLSRD